MKKPIRSDLFMMKLYDQGHNSLIKNLMGTIYDKRGLAYIKFDLMKDIGQFTKGARIEKSNS